MFDFIPIFLVILFSLSAGCVMGYFACKREVSRIIFEDVMFKNLVHQLREELRHDSLYSYSHDIDNTGMYQKQTDDWLTRLNEMLEECDLKLEDK